MSFSRVQHFYYYTCICDFVNSFSFVTFFLIHTFYHIFSRCFLSHRFFITAYCNASVSSYLFKLLSLYLCTVLSRYQSIALICIIQSSRHLSTKICLPRNIFLVDIVKKEQGCPILGAFPCSLSLFIFPTNFYRHPPVKICYLLNAFFSNLSTSFSIHPSSKGLFNPASTITLVKKSRAERLQSL